jgi:predicted ATPase
VEVARQHSANYADGIVFVPLVDISRTYDNLRDILRRTLSLPSDDAQLYDHVARNQQLIIIDNFEHFYEDRDEIARLLQATQHLQLIVTSQVALGLRQEYLIPLSGLNTMPQNEEASRLFVACVQRVQPTFDLSSQRTCVEALCQLVDGIPLAIELAASWLRTLSCEDTLQELQANLQLLRTNAPDVPDRHRSLQIVFDHAWHLLSPDERRVLRRLSVFRGEFGLAAARQVAGASLEVLASLVNHSLVQKTAQGTYRIHNLLRQYAEKQLRTRAEHGKQSKVALAMLSLIEGRFDEVEQLANELMQDAADDLNIDKGFGLALLGVMSGVKTEYEEAFQLCASSLAVTETEPIAALFSYLGIAIAACGLDDFARASTTIRYAIAQAEKLRSPTLSVLCLPAMALVSAHRQQSDAAVQMMGQLYAYQPALPEWLLHWQPLVLLQEALRDNYTADRFADQWQLGVSLDVPMIISRFNASYTSTT